MARNNSVTFMDSASLTLTTGALCDFTDAGALASANSHFYLISDGKAPPRIFSTSVREARVGDSIVLRGLGLSSATVYTPDGEVIPSTLNVVATAVDITFTDPDKVITSGSFQVITPWGISYSGLVNLINKIPLVTPNEIYDLAFYQDAANTVRRLLLSARENTTFRIISFNPADQTTTPFTGQIVLRTGLSVGELAGVPNLFYGRGATPSAVNSKIYKLDFLGGGVESDFRSISLGGDAMAVRATSFFPRIASLPDPRLVFAFDPQITQRRIRQAPADTGVMVSNWAFSTTWNADNSTRNYPAGLAVRHPTSDYSDTPRNTFYTTTGNNPGASGMLSQLQFNYKTGGSSHQTLWTSPLPVPATPLKPAIVNAAQIISEPFGGEHVYVADRGNPAFNYPARIHKVNAGHCGATEGGVGPHDCNTTPSLSFVSSFEYDRVLIDPRGIAIEAGRDVTNGSYSKFLYVSNKPAILGGNWGVSRLRALREIPIKVFIGANAPGNYPLAPPAEQNVTEDQIVTWLNAMVARANLNLYRIGYQIKFDYQDPNDLVRGVADVGAADNVNKFRVSVGSPSGVCSTELGIMMNGTSVDPKRINFFIVRGIIKSGPVGSTDPTFNDPAVGIQSYFPLATPCGTAGIKEAILMTPYAAATCSTPPCPAATAPRASDNVMSHELFHRLVKLLGDVILAAAGYNTTSDDSTRGHRLVDGSGNCLTPSHLMCPVDQLTNSVLLVDGSATGRDDDLANVTLNLGTALILPDKGVVP